MSKAKQLIEHYLATKAAAKPVARRQASQRTRKTTFIIKLGGTVERRIERANGKVEHKSTYGAQEWDLMAARVKQVCRKRSID